MPSLSLRPQSEQISPLGIVSHKDSDNSRFKHFQSMLFSVKYIFDIFPFSFVATRPSVVQLHQCFNFKHTDNTLYELCTQLLTNKRA